VNREIRDLIRQMSVANPLWGAPRIHGEMLKLSIEVSQATVGRHMVRRHGPPSPTWRIFLRNQIDGTVLPTVFYAGPQPSPLATPDTLQMSTRTRVLVKLGHYPAELAR
jgi:hypothetical protein